MKKYHCFEGQEEYNDFLAWAINGSCLIQRMQESSGGVFEIPDYWFYWKQAKNLNAETELNEITRMLPYRLHSRHPVAEYSDLYPDYPDA